MEAMSSAGLACGAAASRSCISRLSLQKHDALRLAQPQQAASLSLQFSQKTIISAQTSSKPLVVSASAAGVAAAPVAVLPVLKLDGATAGEAELSLKTAKPETAKGLVHRAVITFLQNKRRGTASTLTRAEVRGGGRKPYKQKGTGNARQGSKRTPLRPGGGVVFGPKPKDWSIRMNKKERRLAVGTALQSAAVNMTVVEDVGDADFPLPKTRDFVAALGRWGVDYKRDSTLFVTNQLSRNVELASRNIEKLKVTTPMAINIYDILRAEKLVVTLSGLELLNRRFGGDFQDFLEDFEDGEEGEGEVVLRMVGGSLTMEGEGGSIVLEEGVEEGVEEGEEEGGEAEE